MLQYSSEQTGKRGIWAIQMYSDLCEDQWLVKFYIIVKSQIKYMMVYIEKERKYLDRLTRGS